MDGSSYTARAIGQTPTIKFPQTLFNTKLCVAVPLPFFLNKNLCIITDGAATLPTIKSNPLPSKTKGIMILDIDKLSLKLGREKEPEKKSQPAANGLKPPLTASSVVESSDLLVDPRHHMVSLMTHDEVMGTNQ